MPNAYASITMYRGWVVSLVVDSIASHGLEGYADLQFEGASLDRLSYASSSQSFDEALTLLDQEAKAFVDRWHAKAAARRAEQAELIEA